MDCQAEGSRENDNEPLVPWGKISFEKLFKLPASQKQICSMQLVTIALQANPTEILHDLLQSLDTRSVQLATGSDISGSL